MRYDFTTYLDRRGRDSIAADVIPFQDVEVEEGVEPIPMWVADMSFPIAPGVLEAIRGRLDFPSMGYFPLPEAYTESILSWQSRRNGVEGLEKEHIGYENGVLGGVSAAIQMLTRPGEKLLLHSPTYVGFLHVLESTGRLIERSELKQDEDGIWRMDYEDMEKKLREEHIHLAILCSPHNPTGRVWERWELERAMELFARYDCYVISDEIWSDLIMPGCRHIPTQSVSEDARQRTLAFYAPSKTFSLAGLVGSYHIVYNPWLRDRLRSQSAMSHYNSPNILSAYGLIGAYRDSEAWADELCEVIDENHRIACEFFARRAPEIRVMRPQGTYMLFLDCGDYCRSHGVTIRELQLRGVRAGVIWQDGESFLWPDSIRMNLALPKAKLEEALRRLGEKAFL